MSILMGKHEFVNTPREKIQLTIKLYCTFLGFKSRSSFKVIYFGIFEKLFPQWYNSVDKTIQNKSIFLDTQVVFLNNAITVIFFRSPQMKIFS